jgi:hypothetical protein
MYTAFLYSTLVYTSSLSYALSALLATEKAVYGDSEHCALDTPGTDTNTPHRTPSTADR